MFSPPTTAPASSRDMADLDAAAAQFPATINPATLNPAGPYSAHLQGGPFSPPPSASREYVTESGSRPANGSPRGTKRSRSPDAAAGAPESLGVADEAVKPTKKRGRPPKNKPNVPPSPQLSNTPSQPQSSPQLAHHPLPAPGQTTPQQQHALLPQRTPGGSLPTPPPLPKPTPPKPTTVKALPTVRDHTTDQLTPEGDEYIPRETDEAGDKKVTATGHLLGGRDYRCRTFHVPNRGNKLFMLATECARVLGYRDSYLLFNKNRSLYKIIATQAEKDDLIAQEMLPYSYRSRQIAIVTAKSMFRQFGSRVIVDGRRVRDDYWETKARKQGFTEDDPAGEKRPGAAKQRAAAASEQAAAAAAQQSAIQQQGETIYTHGPGGTGVVALDASGAPQPGVAVSGGPVGGGGLVPAGLAPVSLAPLPMIHAMPHEDRQHSKELYAVPRPKQEINGPPYQDRSQSTPLTHIMDHATQTAEFNKGLATNRNVRTAMFNEFFTTVARKSPPPQALPSPPQPAHQAPSQHAPMPQHPQLHPPPMMSPQQLSSLNHQQQQHHQQQQQQQQHHPQQMHPQMMQPGMRSNSGIKPGELHNPGGQYLPQGPYFHPQQQGHPSQQPATPQHQRMPGPQGHPHSMPSMHVQQHPHQPQPPPMYGSPAPQPYMQQQHHPQQHPPPPQGYRPQPQQGQWWSGA